LERFDVSVEFINGRKEEYTDVLKFGPISNTDLFFVALSTGESVVYPLSQNVRKYTFKKIMDKGIS